MTVAVIYGGTRPNGNTEILTEHVMKQIHCEKIYLRDYHILPIIDMRHSKGGFYDRQDEYNTIIDRILPHDILLFATPIYWYSMSGTMKNFVDRWSHTLRDSKYPDFKAKMATKKAFVIAVGGDDPYIKGLPMVHQFTYIFEFIGMEFGGYIIGKGNKPKDIVKDKNAIFLANNLNDKLKQLLNHS